MQDMTSAHAMEEARMKMTREQDQIQKLEQEDKRKKAEMGHKQAEIKKLQDEVNRRTGELQRMQAAEAPIEAEIRAHKNSIQQSVTQINQMNREIQKGGKISNDYNKAA